MTYLIGIAGGSGSGKSTLANGVCEQFSSFIDVIHFDDYMKKKSKVPIDYGFTNWDCPEAIDFESLLSDLDKLKQGFDITVMTKSEKYNPNYKKIGRIPHTIKSKDIIIVEGYLTLSNPKIRCLYDFSIYLNLCEEKRLERRTKFIDSDYTKKILLPMHKKYVKPTKKFADLIINVDKYNSEEIISIVINKLKENKSFNKFLSE